MALVVLVGAGLLVPQLRGARARATPGFAPDGVLTMQLAPPRATYDSAYKVAAFYERLDGAARAVPGVRAAAASTRCR